MKLRARSKIPGRLASLTSVHLILPISRVVMLGNALTSGVMSRLQGKRMNDKRSFDMPVIPEKDVMISSGSMDELDELDELEEHIEWMETERMLSLSVMMGLVMRAIMKTLSSSDSLRTLTSNLRSGRLSVTQSEQISAHKRRNARSDWPAMMISR